MQETMDDKKRMMSDSEATEINQKNVKFFQFMREILDIQ